MIYDLRFATDAQGNSAGPKTTVLAGQASRLTSTAITLHQPPHVFHGGCQTRHHGPADNAVADVQFDQVRHPEQRRQIFVVQSVPGVHLEPERVRLFRTGNEAVEFW